MRDVSRRNAGNGDNGGEELDLSGVGTALWGARKWILLSTVACAAAAIAFVTLVKPRYTAEAKALVENQESYFTRPDKAAADPGQSAPDAEAVASQVQVVMSRDLARDVIRALNLKGNPEFDPAAGSPGLLSGLASILGGKGDSRSLAPEDRIFETYYDRLFVFPVVKSRVLQIEFSSQDPQLAARAANTIAEAYIGVQTAAKRQNARVVATSLATLIADLRARVGEAERKAEEFRASNGILLGANNISMSTQQLGEMNSQLTLARTAQADAQAKSRLIRDMLRDGRIGEVPDVANNDLIRRLSEQRALVRGQIASEGRTLLPGHPRLKELTAQLAEIEGNIRATGEKAARTLENDARIAGARVENLRTALEQQKKTAGGASVDEARARELDREARLLKEQLEASTTKYQEALAREAAESTPADARIISRAVEPPLPSFPKKVPIIVFATMAGLVLSIGTVLARELMSGGAAARAPAAASAEEAPRSESAAFSSGHAPPPEDEAAKDPEPVPRRRFGGFGRSRIPDPFAKSREASRPEPPVERPVESVASAVGEATTPPPRMPARQRVNLSSFVDSAPSRRPAGVQALGRLASDMTGPGRFGACTRVLVVGSDAEADAASIAVALGRTLCVERRAILVEVGGEPAGAEHGPAGLGDLLAGSAGFEDVIHRDRGSALHLMPAGRGDVAMTEGLDVVIDALSRTYDSVILLAPAIGSGGEVYVLAPEVDFTLLVSATRASEETSLNAQAELRCAGATHVMEIGDDAPPGPSRNSSVA